MNYLDDIATPFTNGLLLKLTTENIPHYIYSTRIQIIPDNSFPIRRIRGQMMHHVHISHILTQHNSASHRFGWYIFNINQSGFHDYFLICPVTKELKFIRVNTISKELKNLHTSFHLIVQTFHQYYYCNLHNDLFRSSSTPISPSKVNPSLIGNTSFAIVYQHNSFLLFRIITALKKTINGSVLVPKNNSVSSR